MWPQSQSCSTVPGCAVPSSLPLLRYPSFISTSWGAWREIAAEGSAVAACCYPQSLTVSAINAISSPGARIELPKLLLSLQLTPAWTHGLCCLLFFSFSEFLCFINFQSSNCPCLCPIFPSWDSSNGWWKNKKRLFVLFLPNIAGDSRVPRFPFVSSEVFSSSFPCPFCVITQSEKHLHPIRNSFGYIKLNAKGKKMFDGRVTLSSRKQSGNRHGVPGAPELKNRLGPYF